MSKTLVLAEKPSVGRDLARVLGARNKRNGYFEGDRYLVTWALGHLVGLADPEHYDKKYEKWSLDSLPMMPKKMHLVVLPGSGKQYHIVEKLLRRGDVKDIVIATDAGREGELVARWIIEKARVNKPMKRLWISSQTDAAIRDGFKNLKPSKNYDNLARSALCRAEADWLVGLNVTRALTCRHNAQLSAGRVQTPTLAMIVEREKAIQAFRSEPFYTIEALAGGVVFHWRGRGGGRLKKEEDAKALVKRLSGKNGTISALDAKDKSTPPPPLYDLTSLQRDANARYGMSAKETLRHMQRLYEEHKLLTYPRTDSRHLSQDIVPTLNGRLNALASGSYGDTVRKIKKDKRRIAKSCVNDAKVSDHHAIIPTEQRPGGANLSSDEFKIYNLVVERFLAAFLGPAKFRATTVTLTIDGEPFVASGRQILDPGWQAVGRDMDEEEAEREAEEDTRQSLPAFKKGDKITVSNVRQKEGRTKPPKRFTEGSLLAAMENPQAFVDSKHQQKVLREAGGIGTPATRADIIEKLYQTYYIEKEGANIMPTSKGRQLIDLVPESLRSPVLTAEWEERLTAISRGKESPQSFDRDMRNYAKSLVNDVKNSDVEYRHDNMTRIPCPLCGKYLLDVKGKRSTMRVCQDRECGYKETVSTQSNARCPNCHKKLVVIGKGDKRLYACNTCGFRERFDRFNKKLSEKSNKSTRRDVNAYMKKQQKEEKIGSNAIADAWAKALEDAKKND